MKEKKAENVGFQGKVVRVRPMTKVRISDGDSNMPGTRARIGTGYKERVDRPIKEQ